MSSWFKKELGDAVMAAPDLETLKSQLAESIRAVDDQAPAVFVHYHSPGGLHCEVTVYFSPAAAALATAINAQPCAKPVTAAMSLLQTGDC